MTDSLNLAHLRAVAEAATQGEWQSTGSLIHTALSARVIASTESSDFFALDNLKNSAHITTFDPPTALALIARAEAAESLAEQARREEPYLVWSNEHRAWWRPNSAGYTTHVNAAGRYSRDEAIGIAKGARDGWSWRETRIPDEIAVREADVLACEFTRATQGGKTDA